MGWYHSSIIRNRRRANASSSRYPFHQPGILKNILFSVIYNRVSWLLLPFRLCVCVSDYTFLVRSCPKENDFCFDDVLPIKQHNTYDDGCAMMINLIVEIVRHHPRWLLNTFSETKSSKFKFIKEISFLSVCALNRCQ